MGYKHFYWAILFRLLLIILLAGFTMFLFVEQRSLSLSILSFFLLIGVVINILQYFNRLNKWIAYFLLGIENEDTSLKIPSRSGNKTVDEVYKGMKRLNELFKKTKTEINTREQYFRSIINQSATGLFSVNEKGRVIHINPTAESLTKLQEYHHINALVNIDKALPRFIAQFNHDTKQQSAIFENQHGQKLLFKLTKIIIQNKQIKLVAVSDITKELDNREVDAWIKLARTLSHEMMNNIAPITSISQMIFGYFYRNKRAVSVEEVNTEMIANTVKGLKVIEERGLGLMNFVDNYRRFTKLPEPQLKEVVLSDLIENNLLAASTFSGFSRVTIKKSIPDNFTFVTDEKLLSQVITNLLKNALEALLSENTENPILRIRLWWQTEFTARIEIENNGPMILPELREQIFVPFFSTKEAGSGIGLSLSKQMMLTMGGDILLNTKHKPWTSFIIVLNPTTNV